MAKEPTDVQLEKTGFYRDALNPYSIDWRSSQNAEQERINKLRQNIYGTGETSGQLNQFNTDAETALRRLAAQYAMRGMLRSGGYGGKERGSAVQMQTQQEQQRKQITDPYTEAVNPNSLKQYGLEQVGGETNSPVGMTENFDWLSTNQGQIARSRALQEARNAWLAGKVKF